MKELSDYAKKTIRHKARSLVGRVGFVKDDIEDIEQQMALDLIQRMPKFDRSKAMCATFVTHIVNHKIGKLIRHRTQKMRDYRREALSLNDFIDDSEGGIVERGYTISQDEVDLRIGRRHRTQQEEVMLRIDVSLAMATLPKDLKSIAKHLMTETFTEASKSLGIPRTTIYDARDRLRLIFENAGLNKYL
jgi:RNA polymerase sigma-70 factor (ECF subfamily)